jgi:predicted O-methyltransferase YrrM
VTDPLPEATTRFLRAMAPAPDEVVEAMEAYGAEHGPTTVGRPTGNFFRVLTATAGLERVFEFGSGYGYSGYWFARGGADVVLTDVDEGNLETAREFFSEAGLGDRARFEHGDAHDVIDRLEGAFDAVLIDHRKELYPDALGLARERLPAGGLIVADNATVSTSIQFDRLVERLAGGDPDLNDATHGVATYLETVREDDALQTTVLPIGEGVAVSRKRG